MLICPQKWSLHPFLESDAFGISEYVFKKCTYLFESQRYKERERERDHSSTSLLSGWLQRPTLGQGKARNFLVSKVEAGEGGEKRQALGPSAAFPRLLAGSWTINGATETHVGTNVRCQYYRSIFTGYATTGGPGFWIFKLGMFNWRSSCKYSKIQHTVESKTCLVPSESKLP